MGFEQVALEKGGEFLRNPEDRCPVVLLLDNSISMTGAPLDALNAGLRTFADAVIQDALARKRVDVAVVSFGPVTVVSDFRSAEDFVPPHLEPAGMTPMGGAIERGLELIEARKQEYRAGGIGYYRPWVILITDGDPTDDTTEATRLVHERSEKKALTFFAIGVDNANMARLAQISVRPPVLLKGHEFGKMFEWLSNSLHAVSSSRPEDAHVDLPTIAAWAKT